MIGRAVSALIKRILRQGGKGPWKDIKPLNPSNYEPHLSRMIPHKSPGMPGVTSKNLANLGETHSQWAKSGMTPKYPYLGKFDPRLDSPRGMLNPMSTKKLGASGYADRPSPLIREIEKRYSGAKPNLPGVAKAMNLRWKRPKSAVMGSISRMRRDPGIAAGLGRLESRKASAIASGGRGAMGAGRSAKPARALQYEPSTKRSFANMLRTDKNFEEFVIDSVGIQNVSKVMNNARIRKQLMLQYEKWGAKGHPRTLGEFNEMDVGIDRVIDLS